MSCTAGTFDFTVEAVLPFHSRSPSFSYTLRMYKFPAKKRIRRSGKF